MKPFSKSCMLILLGLLPVFLPAEEKAARQTPAKNAQDKKQEKKEDRFRFIKTLDKPHPVNKSETLVQEEVKPDSAGKEDSLAPRIKQLPEVAPQPKTEKPKERLHFYDDFTMLNGDEEIRVSIVFNSAPLLDVIPTFADTLGFSFLADSTIKSVVTLNIDQKMTRRDLWNTFDRMLNLAGAGVTVDGSLLRIVSLDKLARQPDSRLASDGSGELFYYALKNSTAKEVVNQMKPFLGQSGVIVELTKPNAILVADDRANMPKLKQILEAVDRGGKALWKRRIFETKNILPSRLVEELQAVLPVLGFNVFLKTDRTEQPGSIQLTGVDRLHLLVISAATDEAAKEIMDWASLLDSSDSLDQERVFVYKVRHGKSQDLAKALSNIYEIQGSILTVDTTTGNSKIETLNSNNVNRNRATTQAQNSRNRTNTAATTTTNTQTDRSSNIFDTPVRVFSDGVLNRLIVRTTPRTYASIKALLNRLDVIPAQVLLQVLVVEVRLTENTQFGLEFSLTNQVGGNESLFGANFAELSPGTTAAGQGYKSSNTQTGYTWAIRDPNDPSNTFGYIRALAGNTNVKVISSPQLLVTSHTEASIQVGEDVPYLSQGISNTQSETSVLQNYNYRETGVILTITPQITSNDYIALKVKQELSQADDPAADAAIQSPTFKKRIVNTSMTIANGKTMIIGGMIQEQVEDVQNSLPIINNIPVLNRLIGSTDATVVRTEVLVLITGYIVNERNRIEEMVERYNSAIKALNDFHGRLGNAPEKDRKTEDEPWYERLFKPITTGFDPK